MKLMLRKYPKGPIVAALKSGSFDDLSVEQWSQVWTELMVDSIKMSNLPHDTIPAEIIAYHSVGVSICLNLTTRDGEPITVATTLFEDELSSLSRKRMTEAVNVLVAEWYYPARRGNECAKLLFSEAVKTAAFIGELDGEIAQSIIRDKETEAAMRLQVAYALADAHFANSSPESFWEELKEKVTQQPELAGPLMAWYNKHEMHRDALMVTTLFRPEQMPEYGIFLNALHSVEELLKDVNGTARLKELASRLPDWSLELLRTRVADDHRIRPVKDKLLEVLPS